VTALFAVAMGGALGAVLRFGTNQAVTHWLGLPLFWATLLVNVLGCYLMGLAYHYFIQQEIFSDAVRLFVTVGLLGALTTWSTFSMETVQMIQNDQLGKAALYTLVTATGCFLAFWLGVKS